MKKGLLALAWALAIILLAAAQNRNRSPRLASEFLFERNASILSIEISAEAMHSLRHHPRRDVPALIRVPGRFCELARVHLKGSTTFRPVDDKPSLTVSLLSPTGGISKVHLNNSLDDPTYLQEGIATEFFRAAAIPAPRIGHARVSLNGRDLGLYVVKESFSPEFLARYYSRPDGEIYESDEPLNELRVAAQEANLDARWQKLEALLDVDEAVRFMATEVIICHWDGYCLAGNNVRFYRNPANGRFVFLPSGMDQVFGNPRYPLVPEMAGEIARGLLAIPKARALYERRVRELSGIFEQVHAANLLAYGEEQLRDALSYREWRQLRRDVNELSPRIAAREEFVVSRTERYAQMSLSHEEN